MEGCHHCPTLYSPATCIPHAQRLDSDVLLIQHDAHSPRQSRRLFPRPTAGDGVDSTKSCPLPHSQLALTAVAATKAAIPGLGSDSTSGPGSPRDCRARDKVGRYFSGLTGTLAENSLVSRHSTPKAQSDRILP